MINQKKILIPIISIVALVVIIIAIITLTGNKEALTVQAQETTQNSVSTITSKELVADTTQEVVAVSTHPQFAVKALTRNIDHAEALKEIKDLIEEKTSNITDIPYTEEEVDIVIDYLKTIKGISTNNVISFIDLIMELCDRIDTSFQFNKIYDEFDKSSKVVFAPKGTNTTAKDKGNGKDTSTKITNPKPSTKPLENTPKHNNEVKDSPATNTAEITKTKADFLELKSESALIILNSLRKNNKEVWNAKLEDHPLPTFNYVEDLTAYAQERAKHIYGTGDYSHKGYSELKIHDWYGIPKGEYIVKGTGNLASELTKAYKNNDKLQEGNADNYIGIAVYGTEKSYAIVIIIASIIMK